MKTYTLITGASKGIGYEFAKIFASRGHNLILVARSKDLLEEIKKEFEKKYKVEVIVIVQDLAEELASKKIFTKIKESELIVDVLINNAGFGDYQEFVNSSYDKNMNMIEVNIKALTAMTHLFLPDMIDRNNGKILNIGSIGSFFPGPYMSVYYATKAYVLSFTEALSEELKNTNIVVACLCPGTTDTNFFHVANADNSPMVQLLKPVEPKDVALYGYKRLMKKKVVSIHGFKNRFLVFCNRIVSRKGVRKIVYKIQKKRKTKQ